MASEKNNGEKNSVRYVERAMSMCHLSVMEFFERAKLAGNPPKDCSMEKMVGEFIHSGVVPDYVKAFANLVLGGHCPRKCPKSCVQQTVSRPLGSSRAPIPSFA
jgi:hypothetical protein